jgi:hypothetical protein
MKLCWAIIAGVLAGALATGGIWLASHLLGRDWDAVSEGQAIPADYYTRIDDDTIVVAGTTGRGQWTRITNVEESSTEVSLTIRALSLPGSSTLVGHRISWTVDLSEPLGSRIVRDGFQVVPEHSAREFP